jgi:ankyrin repeat protein
VTTWSFRAAARLVELGEEPDLFAASGMGLIDHVQAFWTDGVLKPSPSRTGSTRYDDTGARLPSPPPVDADQVSDALYIACRCDRLDVARWLLDHGADPNWRGYAGATCLAWAEFSDNPALTALLRAHGGSDEVLDHQYRATPRVFPLMVLAGWGFDPRRLAARFERDPVAVHARTDAGTLLHAAAEGGHVATVQFLLDRGVDRAITNARGLTASDLARAKRHEAVVHLLE